MNLTVDIQEAWINEQLVDGAWTGVGAGALRSLHKFTRQQCCDTVLEYDADITVVLPDLTAVWDE